METPAGRVPKRRISMEGLRHWGDGTLQYTDLLLYSHHHDEQQQYQGHQQVKAIIILQFICIFIGKCSVLWVAPCPICFLAPLMNPSTDGVGTGR